MSDDDGTIDVMNKQLRLLPGVLASVVVRSLEPLILQGSNLAASGGGAEATILQNHYLQWSESIDRVLRSYFESSWVWEELYSRPWEQIRTLTAATARLYPLITDEARGQTEQLSSIVERLKKSQLEFELPPECVAVLLDTSVFLHYQFFRDVNWPKVVQAKEVRLVVPLLVVEQLDRQSYESKPYKARARAVLRALHELREGLQTPEASAVVRPKVTLQMLMDSPDHERIQNEDDELLDRAEYLSSLNGRVVVVTRDLGMELKARLRGLKSLYLIEEPRCG